MNMSVEFVYWVEMPVMAWLSRYAFIMVFRGFVRSCGMYTLSANENSWTAKIWQHTRCGQGRQALKAYDAMREAGVKPSTHTFVALLKACSSLRDLGCAKKIHAEVITSGFESDLYVSNMLVDAYGKCRSLLDARGAFDRIAHRNVVSWTAMIIGYAQMDKGEEALQLYTRMQQKGVVPNDRTYVGALKACSTMATLGENNERCLETVRSIHSDVLKGQFQADVFVGNMLVDAYAKCGSLEDARLVFEKIPCRDVVSWNAMIFGYAQMGKGEMALQLYTRMQHEGLIPDDRTHVGVLKALSAMAESGEKNPSTLETLKTIHRDILKRKLESSLFVDNTLVDTYSKCGSLEDARKVFENMPQRTVVSWTTLIFGYTHVDKGEVALHLYARMQDEGVVPNMRTFVGALNACGSVAGLEKGKEIHAQIVSTGMDTIDSFVANSLIDMYGKCGSMSNAQLVFDALRSRDIVTWSALIAGYAHLGDSENVFDLFQRMMQEGVQPNGITFLSVLTVCSHVGQVNRGQSYFEAMSRDYDIAPTIRHFTCMVDLHGRSGRLDKAMELVDAMPFPPDSTVWQSVLGACRKWGDIELGRHAFDCALQLNRNDAAPYVSMLNIYAAAQMREEARKIQAMRVNSRAWKPPGLSKWTDTRGVTHVFGAGDWGHPDSQDIHAKVRELLVKVKAGGYEPHLASVLRDIPDDEKEDALCEHSEKLAIAYAILKTPSGTTIRVVKNLRVCEDCHRATAVISRLEQRTIICRDSSRFHVFNDGRCSCGDYW